MSHVKQMQFGLGKIAQIGMRARSWGDYALFTESFTVLGVTGGQFRTAARFADQRMLGLRAGDVLHLAIVSEHGATLHTLDQRLAEAGPALGVPTQLLA